MIVIVVVVGEGSYCVKQYVQFTKNGNNTKCFYGKMAQITCYDRAVIYKTHSFFLK